MRILNKRCDAIPPTAVYVGRPSPWGNPYPVAPGRTRAQAISLYRVHLWQLIQAQGPAALLEPLIGHDLVCWCHPLPCHAGVLMQALRWYAYGEISRITAASDGYLTPAQAARVAFLNQVPHPTGPA